MYFYIFALSSCIVICSLVHYRFYVDIEKNIYSEQCFTDISCFEVLISFKFRVVS